MKNAKVNIIVKNDFRFTLDKYQLITDPDDIKNQTGHIIEEENVLNYMVSPANVTISVKKPSAAELRNYGVHFDISPPERTEEALKGKGTIVVHFLKEIDMMVTLETLQTDGRPTGKDLEIYLKCMYPPGHGRLVPVFEPVYGKFSSPIWNGSSAKTPDYSKSLTPAPNASAENLKGMIYNSGYRLTPVYNKVVQVPAGASAQKYGTFDDEYDLTIGDGEKHYILLDMVNNKTYLEIEDAIYSNTGFDSNNWDNDDNNVWAEKLFKDNGEQAIQVSGGQDFVLYTNFGSDYKLYVDVDSPNPRLGYCYIDKSNSISTVSGLTSFLNACDKHVGRENGGHSPGDIGYEYTVYSWSDGSGNHSMTYHSETSTYSYNGINYGSVGYGYKDISILQEMFSGTFYAIPAGSYTGTLSNSQLMTRQQSKECTYPYITSSYVSKCYKWDKITVPVTPYSLLENKVESTNEFKTGGILYKMDWQSGYSGSRPDTTKNFNFDPIVLLPNGQYAHTKPLRYNWAGMNYDCLYSIYCYIGNGDTTFCRNIVTGKIEKWSSSINPAQAEKPTSTSNDGDYFGIINNGKKIYWELQWWSDYTGLSTVYPSPLANAQYQGPIDELGSAYYQLGEAYYKYVSAEPTCYSNSILKTYPLGSELQYTLNGAYVIRQVSNIRPEKERYSASTPAKPVAYYDTPTSVTTNPYRYYPMPSTTKTQLTGVVNNQTAGQIVIKYKNIYGENTLKINVKQAIRQCHADLVTGKYYKMAQSWDDTVLKLPNEIFKRGDGTFVQSPGFYDNSQDWNNKVRVDKKYVGNLP